GTPRRLEEARNQPDRDDHHGAEHEVLDDRLERAETEVIDPAQQNVDLEEEVLRRDAQRREDDADHERKHQKPDQDPAGATAQKRFGIHGLSLLASPQPQTRTLRPAAIA